MERFRALGGACLSVAVLIAGLPAASARAEEPGRIREFIVPHAGAEPEAIVPGADENLWFSEFGTFSIGRITPGGEIAEFPLPHQEAKPDPEGMALGPDGNVWFVVPNTDEIGKITPGGAIAEFTLPTAKSTPTAIAAGPEGNLWFTEYEADMIGRITLEGAIKEFPIPTPESKPYVIARGPDGNMWFTEQQGNKIGRITPEGAIKEFPLETPESEPQGITAGPDGNIWFAEFGDKADKIGRITPSGSIIEFPVSTEKAGPWMIEPGSDGALWFTENKVGKIGRLTTNGGLSEFTVPTPKSGTSRIAPGSDGNLWFTEFFGNKVGRIGTGSAPALTSPPAVVGGGVAGSPQTCDAATYASWASLEPSPAFYAFDGYRWLLNGAQVAAGHTYTPAMAAIGHQLSCSETVTYPLLEVTVSGTSAPVTVLAPTPPTAPLVHAPSRPVLSRVRQAATRWREGSKLVRITRRVRPPVGTAFSFALNTKATVRFTFSRQVGGRLVGHRCVPRSSQNAHRNRCSRLVTAGTIVFVAHAGTNKVAFQGRISRRKRLAPGRYTLSIIATASGLSSPPAKLSFTIVK